METNEGMTLDEAKLLVASWANHQRLIRRIFFFGSRVRNEHRPDSDLDIAIELIYPNPDISAAHWAFESDAWVLTLSTMLPWELDMQCFNSQGTPTIAQGISRSSILVYVKHG